jgi:hypothetical protein
VHRKIAAVGVGVLATAAIVSVLIARDEQKLRIVREGARASTIKDALGNPSLVLDADFLGRYSLYLPTDPACRTRVRFAYVYERRLRRSLCVYLDGSGVVLCAERRTIYQGGADAAARSVRDPF